MSEWNDINTSSTFPEKEKIEFEIEDDKNINNEQLDSKNSDEKSNLDSKEVSSTDSSSEDKMLEGVETKGAQKRIRQLIQQRKEKEERIAALEAEKEDLRRKLLNQEKDLSFSLKKNIDSSEQFFLDKINYSKKIYEKAAEEGNTSSMLEAQEEMAKAHAELVGLRGNKESWKRYNEQVEAQQNAQTASVPTQQTTPQQKQQYDPKAVEWASRNEWFGSNNVMTASALAIDYELKNEGYDPSDQEFYEEIDRRMKEQFPHKFQNAEDKSSTSRKPNTSTSAQVVAGASRTPASPSSSKKIKLTQEDVRLANKWGIPLERYAEEKLKAERSVGDYTTIG